MKCMASLVSELKLFIDNCLILLWKRNCCLILLWKRICCQVKICAFENSSLATVNQWLLQAGVSKLHTQFRVEGSWQSKSKYLEAL